MIQTEGQAKLFRFCFQSEFVRENSQMVNLQLLIHISEKQKRWASISEGMIKQQLDHVCCCCRGFSTALKAFSPLLTSEIIPRISAVTTNAEDYPAAEIIFTKTRVHDFPHKCQNFFLETRCHREIHKFI